MRSLGIVAVALVGFVSGCTGFDFVLRPPPQFIELETWTDVPEGQQTFTARVGDVLHLPVGRSPTDHEFLPPFTKVTVNGQDPEIPSFWQSSKVVCYVFRAEKPGQYRVECSSLFDLNRQSPRTWVISVVE
jgi:hypothetical protein